MLVQGLSSMSSEIPNLASKGSHRELICMMPISEAPPQFPSRPLGCIRLSPPAPALSPPHKLGRALRPASSRAGPDGLVVLLAQPGAQKRGPIGPQIEARPHDRQAVVAPAKGARALDQTQSRAQRASFASTGFN